VSLRDADARSVDLHLHSTPASFSDPVFVKYSDRQWISQRKDSAFQAKTAKEASGQSCKPALEVVSRNMKKLADAGVTIAMGRHRPARPVTGYFELMELELMAKAGLTSKQVLLSATRDAALPQDRRGAGNARTEESGPISWC
jgi:hypothetical protein